MKTLILIFALALTGCATSPEYIQYAKSTEATSVAKYTALAKIAESGDRSSGPMAVMALALGAGSTQLQAPPQNSILQWAQVLVPGLTQMVGMRYQYLSTVTQSNNAAATAQSTNNTFGTIAGLIQAAPTVTTINDRHDVVTPAPVVITPTPLVPVVINPPTVITPVVQVTPVFVP